MWGGRGLSNGTEGLFNTVSIGVGKQADSSGRFLGWLVRGALPTCDGVDLLCLVRLLGRCVCRYVG